MGFYQPVDTELDSSYDPKCGLKLPAAVNSIFLTGANGFLGCYILSKLLQVSQAKIYCLVRGKTHQYAVQKLISALQRYNLNVDWERVIVVRGDICEHQLGIDAEEYLLLCQNVDVIIHNAADVRLFVGYDTVYASNILGLRSALKLAVTGKLKFFTFISSFSVFNAHVYSDVSVAKEQTLVGDGAGLRFGYAQSKWVGERICENARLRDIPVTIIRPPYILGDSITSAVNQTGVIETILRSVLVSNSAPDLNFKLHSIPVDICAEMIADIVLKIVKESYIFHVIPFVAITWTQLLESARNLGYDITVMPPEEWYQYLQKCFLNQPSVIDTISILCQDDSRTLWENANVWRIKFDCENLWRLPSTFNLNSKLDAQFINHYLQSIENFNRGNS